MFARNVAFSLKPNSVPEFTQKFESEVLPLLQKPDLCTESELSGNN